MIFEKTLRQIQDITDKYSRSKIHSRVAVFDQLIKPLKEKLEIIHTGYIDIFKNLIISVKYKGNIILAKKQFIKNRWLDYGVRVSFRNETQGILKSLNNSAERGYILSVAYYFLKESNLYIMPNNFIDAFIKINVESGGDDNFDSPTYRFESELEKLDDKSEIENRARHLLHGLNDRYSATLSFYMHLMSEIEEARKISS